MKLQLSNIINRLFKHWHPFSYHTSLGSKVKEDKNVVSMSSIENSSSVHKVTFAEKEINEKEKDFALPNPEEICLREDGQLPTFPDQESIMKYFEPFMLKLLDFIEKIKTDDNPQVLMNKMEEVAIFILSILSRISSMNETHKLYFDVLESNVEDMIAMGKEELKWREMTDLVNNSSWPKIKNDIMKQQAEPKSSPHQTTILYSNSAKFTKPNTEVKTASSVDTKQPAKSPSTSTNTALSSTAPVSSGNSPDDGGGDDDSDKDDDPDDKKKQPSLPRSNKKKRSDKKKKRRSVENDSSTSEDESDSNLSDGIVPNDTLY